MPRKRTLSNIIDDDSQPVVKTTKRKRAKVPCDCDKCKGKLVDPRTKKIKFLHKFLLWIL